MAVKELRLWAWQGEDGFIYWGEGFFYYKADMERDRNFKKMSRSCRPVLVTITPIKKAGKR